MDTLHFRVQRGLGVPRRHRRDIVAISQLIVEIDIARHLGERSHRIWFERLRVVGPGAVNGQASGHCDRRGGRYGGGGPKEVAAVDFAVTIDFSRDSSLDVRCGYFAVRFRPKAFKGAPKNSSFLLLEKRDDGFANSCILLFVEHDGARMSAWGSAK